jgi:hypothetical protein
LFLIFLPLISLLYSLYAHPSAECFGCALIIPVVTLISGAAAGLFRLGKRQTLGIMGASAVIVASAFFPEGLETGMELGLLSVAVFLIGWGIGTLVSWGWIRFFPDAYEYVMARLRLMWVLVTSLVIYALGIVFNIVDWRMSGWSILIPRDDFFFVAPFIIVYVGMLLHAYRLQKTVSEHA